MIYNSESFQKSSLAQTMCQITLYSDEKIGQILRAVLEKSKKILTIGHSTPFNPVLSFFNASNLAQTMHLLVLYDHAKNWEVP